MKALALLACADCAWRGTFAQAVDHYRGSRHVVVSHSGHPQDLSKFVGCCQGCGTDLAIHPSMCDALLPDRTFCDRCVFDKLRQREATT